MRDTEYYRAEAEFWADLANETKRPDYQDRWLRLAQEWRELAEQAAVEQSTAKTHTS